MPSTRHASLELLRSAAALAVVGVHAAAMVLVALPDGQDSAWWAANLWDSFCHWCVPVFVMISGAVLLSGPADQPAAEFYRRRALRLWRPTVFWTLLYLALAAATAPQWSLLRAAGSLLRGTPWYHLWYLYMLPGLYLLTPFLRRLIARSNDTELRGLTIACCALAAVGTATPSTSATFLTSFLPFTGYFLLGHLLFTHPTQPRSPGLLVLMLVAGSGVALGAGLLRPWLGPRAIELMYAYPNPLILLMGVCMFLLGLRRHAGFITHLAAGCVRLAPLSFGIYLIHPLWLLALARIGINGFLWHPAVGIPLTTLAAFALSALSTALLLRIPFIRQTVR
ncbi:acyltransferase family protein [Uliginosibacterium sp. 31-16]|uniref:acyltransferase n=1 Tax=Uliginosibacterium sp. 31-16 TaxID=3068315 RepID=UPI00273EE778|nr:acyltransferase family protein [Uliginosibacterium sp. 31-16]MDP5239264.1 acyltransferase family protein [Uliginosibacterium sp. 31-16]